MSTNPRKIRVPAQEDLANLPPNQSFQHMTGLIRKHPHNPILWHNRAYVVLQMGYPDQAISDAKHACDLIKSGQPQVVSALTSYLSCNLEKNIRENIDFEHAERKFACEALYTYARALIVSRFQGDDLKIALISLKDAMSRLPHDADFQIKAKRLEEQGKKEYHNFLEYLKSNKDHIALRAIKRPGMRDGRYPWDTMDARGRTARTKEGLKELDKEYNEVLDKLGASKVEARFAICYRITGGPNNVQETTGFTADDLQVGMYAKRPIRNGESVLCERAIANVNLRLNNDVRCEHCNVVCDHLVRRHECPRCQIIYCSTRCRKEADATYHKVLCKRHHQFEWFFEQARKARTTPVTFPLQVVKLFAMSLQTSTPLLELPGITHLRPWSPARDGVSYRIASTVTYYYPRILEAFEIGPEQWLDYDYWIYETLCRMIMGNSFRIQAREDGKTSGLKIFEATSWFNHSCDPNCQVSGVDQVEAIRPISSGEELTITYCESDIPRADRQDKLELSFGFECTCSRCEAEDVVTVTLGSMMI
ncbi:hypothetical protein BC938DRAFT_473391 [Jimgerdemannia flammicorona]|uniref:SET domain-containing protein n=1 Tax=Jimgerdemannia flammicorona TaxID=994334 RepID=A0A433QZZ4_9FUNG|nr:hypothetical protein BC938DRAFT_473391 [Jimgerdemannia flammicorona]